MTDISLLCATVQSARVVDLSHALEEHMPHFPTHSKFFHNLYNSYWHGDGSLGYQLLVHEHAGTHVDAPAHFISDAMPSAHITVDGIPPGRLIGRGVRLDCRDFKVGNYVSKAFISAWEAKHGQLQPGDIVLCNFGWDKYWGLRPDGQQYLKDWPGVSREAAEHLIENSVAAIGVDTLSPDPPEALQAGPIHPLLLQNHVLIIENLTNLDALPEFFVFLALPLKIRGGSGSPIRAVALL